jgi:mRNA interferase MazF
MVDLGLAAKVRPCVVVSVPLEDTDRSLVTVVPHTTSLRQSRFEVTAASPRFLKSGAFDVQGIVTVPTVRLMNRLGTLSGDQIRALEKAICSWLGISIAA